MTVNITLDCLLAMEPDKIHLFVGEDEDPTDTWTIDELVDGFLDSITVMTDDKKLGVPAREPMSVEEATEMAECLEKAAKTLREAIEAGSKLT